MHKISGVLLGCMLLLGAWAGAQEAAHPPFPADAEAMGKFLCAQLDLNHPGLGMVRARAQSGKFAEALAAWRDYQVNAIRKRDAGQFGWHGDQQNGYRLNCAEFLTGRISPEEFAKKQAGRNPFFTDLFGLRGSPDQPIQTNWLAKDAAGNYLIDYMNFYFAIPLAVRYWQSGDAIYLKKWFQIAADFARNQKRAVEALDEKTRRTVPCRWDIDAGGALSQGDRVIAIIRSLGVLCKSLPGEGKPAKWDAVNKPVDAPVSDAARELTPPVELAQVACSLVLDHPDALRRRYLKAGAVPNQRRGGLTALLLTAVAFPEFTASRELLNQGAAGLDDYLQGAYHLDGGMLEQSFNYNLGDANSLGEMAEWLRSALPTLADKLLDRQRAFYRMTAALSTPLERLPAMSSFGPANPPPVWKDAKARDKWLADQTLAMPGKNDPFVARIAAQFSDKTTETAPAFTSVAFPYSGYYAQRLNWRWDSPYLFMQGCRPGRGHATRGQNAIQVMAYGRPLLVTAGLPVYMPEQLPAESRPDFKAINELFGEHSSLKVNTVLLDGKSQSAKVEVLQTAPNTTVNARWHTSPRFDFMEGFYDLGYPKPGMVNHRRQVVFVRDPGFWLVADIMTNVDRKEHAFSQVWNFPSYHEDAKTPGYGFKNEEVVADEAGRNIHTAEATGPNVWLYHCGGGALEYAKYFGRKNPYLGWFSPGFGNLMPAAQVFATWKSAGNSVLLTVIWPARDAARPDVKISDVSPKGDGARAGVALQLPGGAVLTCQVAHDAASLQAEGIALEAQALLTLKAADGGVHGLALGRKAGAPGDFEFRLDGKEMKDIVPIQTPQGFVWRETAQGFQPDYTQSK